MFDQFTQGLFEQDKIHQIHAIEDLGNDDIRAVGTELIFGRIFDKIGYNKIPEPLFRDMVISRITHSGSKLKLVEYLQENKGQEISVYSIYRYMNKANKPESTRNQYEEGSLFIELYCLNHSGYSSSLLLDSNFVYAINCCIFNLEN